MWPRSKNVPFQTFQCPTIEWPGLAAVGQVSFTFASQYILKLFPKTKLQCCSVAVHCNALCPLSHNHSPCLKAGMIPPRLKTAQTWKPSNSISTSGRPSFFALKIEMLHQSQIFRIFEAWQQRIHANVQHLVSPLKAALLIATATSYRWRLPWLVQKVIYVWPNDYWSAFSSELCP